MVKVQKPNPKTFKNNPKKVDKSKGVKKEKPVKDDRAIPSSNVTAKKAKTKLIQKAVQENQIKAKNNVEKVKKPPVPEEPQVKKGEKKVHPKGATKEQGVGFVKSVKAKPFTKKSKKPIGDVKKQFRQVQEKKPETEDKAQKKGKPQKKKSAAGVQPQILSGKKQGKNVPAPSKKEKKTTVPAAQFEPQPFDEDQFNAVVNAENIKKISQALKALVEKEVSEKKSSIFSDFRYFLNICSYRIPNCPKRIVKLNLEHSLVDTSEDDVVIVVPDLKRGAKVDNEPTVQHYEDLFQEAGVTGLKIVPFNQLRKECTTFETKRKFANSHDYFMCDGRIVAHVVGFCGKFFQKPRTTFHAVRLDNPKTYEYDIGHALKRTSYNQLQKGDLVSIPVGNHRFNIDQLTDNIQLVIKQLKTLFAGGLANIRNMHLKIDIKGTSAIPLYVNLAGAPADTPIVVGLRELQMLKLKKEANEVLTQFNLSKTGEFVKLKRNEVERKRQIKEAVKALLSKEEVEVPPAKKSKKGKQESKLESEDKPDNNEDESGDDNEDESGDDNEDESGDDNEDESGDDNKDESGDDNDDESGDDNKVESGDDNEDECDDADEDDN